MGNGVNWSDMWNSWGNFGFGGGGMGMPFGGGFGGMGSAWGDGFNYGAVGDSWGGSSSSSSSSSKLTDEEKKAQALEKTRINREIKSIRDLLQGLVKDENILTTTERDSLDYDLKHLPSKPQEKLDAIKNLYNQYKDTIKNNLGKIEALSKDFAGIGYESETDVDEAVSTLSSAISSETEQVLALEDTEVLDLLSSWNSNSATGGKHLMETLIEKYTALPETQEGDKGSEVQARRASLETLATSLKSKLSTKAGDLANNANLKDDTLKNKLKALRSALDSTSLEDCAKVFDNLYQLCRIAGAKVLENTYKEQYEFLGSDNLFGNIVSETEADLSQEGFGKIEDIEIPLTSDELSNMPSSDALEKLEKEGLLVKKDGGIYEEKAGNPPRQFKIKGDKIVEIKNGNETEISAQTLFDDLKNKKEESKNVTYTVKSDDVKDLFAAGGDSGKNNGGLLELVGNTSDDDWVRILSVVGVTGRTGDGDNMTEWSNKNGESKVNKNNILAVLGYFNGNARHSSDFFLQLYEESGSGAANSREKFLADRMLGYLEGFIADRLAEETDEKYKSALNDTKSKLATLKGSIDLTGSKNMDKSACKALDEAVNNLIKLYGEKQVSSEKVESKDSEGAKDFVKDANDENVKKAFTDESDTDNKHDGGLYRLQGVTDLEDAQHILGVLGYTNYYGDVTKCNYQPVNSCVNEKNILAVLYHYNNSSEKNGDKFFEQLYSETGSDSKNGYEKMVAKTMTDYLSKFIEARLKVETDSSKKQVLEKTKTAISSFNVRYEVDTQGFDAKAEAISLDQCVDELAVAYGIELAVQS